MTTKLKAAVATRINGNLYDVTYPETRGLDKAVGYDYLRRLARDGFAVKVEQRTHRGPGEPESYDVTLD